MIYIGCQTYYIFLPQRVIIESLCTQLYQIKHILGRKEIREWDILGI